MIQFLQNGHNQVLICVILLLAALIVIQQRFPWLQRWVGKQFQRWSSPLAIASGLLVLICGSIGFAWKECDSADSFSTALYETFQIFSFNVPYTELDTPILWCSKIFAMILATTVAAKGISLLFHDSSVRLLLLGAKEHVVVCGLGRIGRQLIEDLLDKDDGRRIVVLEPDEDNHNLKWARENGVITIIGDATKSENLDDVGVARAAEVFVVTGSDECNIEAAVEIGTILKERGRLSYWLRRPLLPLKCFVHVLDRDLALIIREHADSLEQLSARQEYAGQVRADAPWDVEVFNALERTARRLLEDIATSRFNEKSMRPATDSEVAHFVMLGFGTFGQTLALQLAELAHFENGKRLRLTVCDRDIQKTAEPFTARYVRFGPQHVTTTNWDFKEDSDQWGLRDNRHAQSDQVSESLAGTTPAGIEFVCNARYIEYTEATDDAFLDCLSKAFNETGVKPTILVCFENDRNNFALAERLRTKLETRGQAWPIFVWIPRQRELSQLLDENRRQHSKSVKLHANQTPKFACDVFPLANATGLCHTMKSQTVGPTGWPDILSWSGSHQRLANLSNNFMRHLPPRRDDSSFMNWIGRNWMFFLRSCG